MSKPSNLQARADPSVFGQVPQSAERVAETSHPAAAAAETRKAIVYGPGGSKLSLADSCRAIVIEAIQSHLSIPADEQHLLQEPSSQPGVDYYRVERKMDPRKLRFTQDSISTNFRDGRPIVQLLNDLNQQAIDPLRELEALDVVWHNGFWRSLSEQKVMGTEALYPGYDWATTFCQGAGEAG